MTFDIKKFILAGNATITAKSAYTGKHFTFRVRKAKKPECVSITHFVQLLVGPDNESSFSYLGIIRFENMYEHGFRSVIGRDATSAKAAQWLFSRILNNQPTPNCAVYHAGKCGRCGRKLTTPESIETGFGPECKNFI